MFHLSLNLMITFILNCTKRSKETNQENFHGLEDEKQEMDA